MKPRRLPASGPLVSQALAALLLAASAHPLSARQNEADRWRVEGEVGASVFFGNTDQTAITTRIGTDRNGPSGEFSVDGSFNYGEATDAEGRRRVNKRSWKVDVDLDPVPEARLSPFLAGRAEGSHEKRIDLRYNLGAGGKLRVAGEGSSDRLDLSVALLAERTHPSDLAPESADDDLEARWSTRLRARRTLSEGRVTIQSETHYQPAMDRIDDFVLNSTSSVAFRLTEVVSLKLTFVDSYDSGATDRGARSNNDGQLFFSVLSAFTP